MGTGYIPVGELDAGYVECTYNGETLQKARQAMFIADPLVASARLRLALVDGTYRLPVSEVPNKISDSVADAGAVAGNSRDAATLAAAGTFQGVSEEVSGYGRVGVAFKSDNATDGTLTMETSLDGVTWGGPTRSIANTSIAQSVMWNIVEKYFRIKYVNGTTEAENLAIQVQYSNNANTTLGHPLDETLPEEVGASIVRLGSQYDLDVLKGRITGTEAAPIVAHSDTVGTNLRHLYPEHNTADTAHEALFDTPATVKVSSSSDADNGGTATGALTVAIVGVNSAGAATVEIVTLDGQTAATTTATFKAIHSAIVITAGSGKTNAGVIWVGNGTVTSGVPATKYMAMEIGTSSSRGFVYLVPTGKTLFIEDLNINVSDTARDLTLQLITYTGSVRYEALILNTTGNSEVRVPLTTYPGITAGTLVYMNAKLDQGTAVVTAIVNAKLTNA